jgi:hypothetical protein
VGNVGSGQAEAVQRGAVRVVQHIRSSLPAQPVHAHGTQRSMRVLSRPAIQRPAQQEVVPGLAEYVVQGSRSSIVDDRCVG